MSSSSPRSRPTARPVSGSSQRERRREQLPGGHPARARRRLRLARHPGRAAGRPAGDPAVARPRGPCRPARPPRAGLPGPPRPQGPAARRPVPHEQRRERRRPGRHVPGVRRRRPHRRQAARRPRRRRAALRPRRGRSRVDQRRENGCAAVKIHYDTEFLEDGKTIDLISIGMVREDGAEYYAENSEADWDRMKKSDWLVRNVLPGLKIVGRKSLDTYLKNSPNSFPRPPIEFVDPDVTSSLVKPRQVIANEVRDFILATPRPG